MAPRVLMDTADGGHVHGAGTTRAFRDGFRHQFSYLGKRHAVYGKAEPDLKRAKRDKIAALDAAEAARLAAAATNTVMTVAAWVERWKASHAEWSPDTVKNYDRYLNRYILPEFGRCLLTSIEPIVVRDFIAKIPKQYVDSKGKTRTFGATSRDHCFHVVKSLMQDAESNPGVSGLERDLIRKMKSPSPREDGESEDPWTPEEVETFFRGCKGHYLAVPFALAGFGGMRESEILGLTWADVDFDEKVVRVEMQLGREHVLRTRLKSKKEQESRVVALPEQVMKMLAAYKARKRAQEMKAGSRWKGTADLVVTTYLGPPYSHRNFLRELARLAKRHGMRHTSLHGLRRAADSLLKMRGVPGAVRQQFMGHASLRTTERYDYLYEETIRGAGAALDEAFPWLAELADAM